MSAFGAGATSPFQLAIEGNGLLQRSIARAFNFQELDSINAATVTGTPTQILNKLLQGYTRTISIQGHEQAFLYDGPLAKNGSAKIVIYRPGKEKVRVIPVG